MKVGSNSPWGKVDQIKEITKGIIQVSTPGHGGYKVYAKLNNQIPDYMRNADGWYEEDTEVAIVQIVFPQFFHPEFLNGAKLCVANWYPDAYEKFYRITLNPGESHVKDERDFEKKNENNWVVICAWGGEDIPKKIPENMVGCIATKGGKRGNHIQTPEEKNFLVPSEEYEIRNHYGFVIDESKHQVWNRGDN